MSATNGQVKQQENHHAPGQLVAGHIFKAESLLNSIDPADLTDAEKIALGHAWAALGTLVVTTEYAADHDRIASCVPEGASAFDVALRGPRR